MEYDKIIESMATKMYEDDFEHPWRFCGTFREAYTKRAKAALAALQEEMPDINTGIILEDAINTANLYQQLRALGK